MKDNLSLIKLLLEEINIEELVVNICEDGKGNKFKLVTDGNTANIFKNDEVIENPKLLEFLIKNILHLYHNEI